MTLWLILSSVILWRCLEAWETRPWELGTKSLPNLMSLLLLFHSSAPVDRFQAPHTQAGRANQRWKPNLTWVLHLFWQAPRNGHLLLFHRPVARSRRKNFHQREGKKVLLFCKTTKVGKGVFLHTLFRKLYVKFGERETICLLPKNWPSFGEFSEIFQP